MSTTQKVKLYVMAVKDRWKNEFRILVDTDDRTNWTHDTSTIHILLSEVEIEVPVPELNQKQLTLMEVDQLKEVIQKEKADSHVRITAIEEKIQSLLCIEAK